MNNYHLSHSTRKKLKQLHRQEHDKQKADRIKAVYLLGSGWPVQQVAAALLLSENSLRNYCRAYQEGGVAKLLTVDYCNNSSYLSDAQLAKLNQHLKAVVYLRVQDIVSYVSKTFKVNYSLQGMTDLLHRLNFVYKKPKLSAAKADRKKQQRFIRKYQSIQAQCGADDAIYFMDATHPHYQTVAGYGWIKQGEEVHLPLTLTQKPLNINGAINIENLKGVFQYQSQTLKKEHTADLLLALRKQHPKGWIYLISDRGGCYYSAEVNKFAKGLGIKMIYLPPYSPNLNVIERLWLFFKKKVLYNRHYESYEEFCAASQQFFNQLPKYKNALRTLLTDNFHLCPN